MTRAGKMIRNAHILILKCLILSYRQKKGKMSVLVEFEVFAKMSSLSPLLAIPVLQIVNKHLKWSLFVHFLNGVHFSLLTSGRLLLFLTTSCRSIVAKRSIPALWIFISNSRWHKSKPVKYHFQTHHENKTIMLTDICKAKIWERTISL